MLVFGCGQEEVVGENRGREEINTNISYFEKKKKKRERNKNRLNRNPIITFNLSLVFTHLRIYFLFNNSQIKHENKLAFRLRFDAMMENGCFGGGVLDGCLHGGLVRCVM